MPGEGGGRPAGRRRSAGQAELQKAVSAHAAREQTADYSDDFESDEDGMLNGAGEDNESSSGADSTNKSVVVESPLSDDDASQKAADLENEAADDLTLSFHEKKLQQKLLESESIQDDRKDGEEEYLAFQNESDDRKQTEECSAAEEVPCGNSRSDPCSDLPVQELQKRRNQEEHKPIPKPRGHKTRNASGSDQDQKKISTSDLKLKDSSRKSPSVTEVMSHEKTKELAKSTEDCSDEVVKGVEGQRVNDTIEEVSVNDQPEHEEAKKTSEDSVKKPSEIKEGVPENSKASLSGRPLSSAHFKKKAKAVPSAPPVSSQYLGTLKVLEDKHVQKKRTEFDRADSVRAAVFQNWWEKKRVILQESKRLEKKKAENLRNNTEKKEAVKREEAIASFEAWKKKKGREAKKLSEKKKLEELKKKKKAAEENEEKTEAAQKAFEKWKERKAEYLREQSRKEKQSERIRKKKEEELMAEKKRDSMSAVEKWNEKKREYIKQKKVEEILERRKQEIQQAKMEEKNKKAMEEYERWLERKERREQLEKKQKKLQAACRDEVPSPWSPPGRVTYSRNY